MSSIDMDGIILDISEDNQVMAIEILDASKRFYLVKEDLRNINCFEALIEVNKDKHQADYENERHQEKQTG